MKILAEAADYYGDLMFGFSNENYDLWVDCRNHFIAGATSKYVEAEKLKFAIEQLKSIKLGLNDANTVTVFD